ncbi:hypothetical protein LXL04_002790 [Taraxacum kok-saghyz]
MCDNAPALAKAYSQVYNGKSKHLGVRYNAIREVILNETLDIATKQVDNGGQWKKWRMLRVHLYILKCQACLRAVLNTAHGEKPLCSSEEDERRKSEDESMRVLGLRRDLTGSIY